MASATEAAVISHMSMAFSVETNPGNRGIMRLMSINFEYGDQKESILSITFVFVKICFDV